MNGTFRPVLFIVTLATTAVTARAQAPAPAASLPIQDNSFLIEEAYNQGWGVVQHISTFQRVRGAFGWAATFTQEWPAPSQRHQLSYTVPIQRSMTTGGEHTGIGDIALNYRYQMPMAPGSRVAASPRLSVVFPTGREEWGQGSGSAGLQLNLPLSIELSPWLVSHSNLGGSWTPSAKNEIGEKATATGFFVGQSLIWLVHQKFNVMLESIWTHDASVVGTDQTAWERGLLISPGVRAAFDLPSGLQIVPGIAVPLGIGPSDGLRGVFVYLSFEHPFRKQ